VLLLDDSPPGAARVGESLPPAGRSLLRDLGVLEPFLADGHLASHGNVSVWGTAGTHATDFIFNLQGHGWQLDRARFDALLRGAAADAGVEVRPRAAADAGVEVRPRTTLAAARREVSPGDGGWTLPVSAAGGPEEEVRCRWVVDATGRRAAVARRHGAVRLYGDALVAFHARFRPAPGAEADRDARTRVEAAPDGWWYTALVPSGERVVAYLTDGDLADRAALLSAEGFTAAVEETEAIRAALAAHGFMIAGRPRGTDAGSACLDRFVGDGWIAAGDAALSFDPLSSQGILNALYTGMRAGEALAAHLAGDGGALGAYAARLDSIVEAYRRNWATYYALETRWPERPFWARRTVPAGEGEDEAAGETARTAG
jgi:flavin-dependent dehydrogenase